MSSYGFQIPGEIERRMRRCRAPMRAAIQRQLDEIAASAGNAAARDAKRTVRPAKAPVRKEPPLRFYVYEGYRVAYELDVDRRKVVVLDLEPLPVA
ncbi:MAG TPA: hypothetical protein VLA14_04140 [Polyangia bacterium]|jgi:hypothetical protein|nr:hypothetical protein [Polyangia bacterium]